MPSLMTDDYMRETCFNYRPLNMSTASLFKVKTTPQYLTTRSNGFITAPMPSVPPRNIDDLTIRLTQVRRLNELQGLKSNMETMIKSKIEKEMSGLVDNPTIFQRRRQSDNNFSKNLIEAGSLREDLDDDIDEDVVIEFEDETPDDIKTPVDYRENKDFYDNAAYGKEYDYDLHKMYSERKERTDKGQKHDYPESRKKRGGMRGAEEIIITDEL